jgi:hypothetical protein
VRNPSPHIFPHRSSSTCISLKAAATGVLPDTCTRIVPVQASRKDRSPSMTDSRSGNTYDYVHGRRTFARARYEFLTCIHQHNSFITFTDDFSHYGYIYPIHERSEAIEEENITGGILLTGKFPDHLLNF